MAAKRRRMRQQAPFEETDLENLTHRPRRQLTFRRSLSCHGGGSAAARVPEVAKRLHPEGQGIEHHARVGQFGRPEHGPSPDYLLQNRTPPLLGSGRAIDVGSGRTGRHDDSIRFIGQIGTIFIQKAICPLTGNEPRPPGRRLELPIKAEGVVFGEHPACMRVPWRPISAGVRPRGETAASSGVVTEDFDIDRVTP